MKLPQSKVVEAELQEDIPLNSAIEELSEDISFFAELRKCNYDNAPRVELRKQNFLNSLIRKGSFAKHSLLSGVAEAELKPDISPLERS